MLVAAEVDVHSHGHTALEGPHHLAGGSALVGVASHEVQHVWLVEVSQISERVAPVQVAPLPHPRYRSDCDGTSAACHRSHLASLLAFAAACLLLVTGFVALVGCIPAHSQQWPH